MDKLENKKLAIIGVGNMGRAIMKGLLGKSVVDKNNLFLSNSSRGNERAVKSAKVIILAVKPQILFEVLVQIKDFLTDKHLLISIAAGVSIQSIQQRIGKRSIIRAMPNLCAVVGKSMTVWVKNKHVEKEQEIFAKRIFSSIGNEEEIFQEDKLNQVTAISGSGPAYVFYLAELLENSAVKIGVKKELAKELAYMTMDGAVSVLRSSKKSSGELRKQVTSKGGTTEAAFKEFEKSKLQEIFFKGIKSASNRAEELNRMIY